MATSKSGHNRVKQRREALGMSQEQLSQVAGISRTGLSAIEGERLTPSVATALALGRALALPVEALFGEAVTSSEVAWARKPDSFPARYWSAEVRGKTVLFPVERTTGLVQKQDGVAKKLAYDHKTTDLARRTLVVATCDPAAGHLAKQFERQTPFRLMVLSRTSRDALHLLHDGLVHAAGVHFAAAEHAEGNAGILSRMEGKEDLNLLSVATWEEGIAYARHLQIRSAKHAVQPKVRWIGRALGAGARRSQDEVLGSRAAPRHIASGHDEVVGSIRAGFADAGICVRMVAEEGNVGFVPLERDDYDLCFPAALADDPRLLALIEVVKSTEYRKTLAELPGYRASRAGQLTTLKASTKQS